MTSDNLVRTESDIAIKKIHDKVGLNKILHNRNPTPSDKQNIIRMNRDTIYSFAVGDLSKPMTVTLPETDGSYTIYFGDCASGKVNCLNIIRGWNYIFRMYEPRQEIIDGTWKVPPVRPIR